MSKYKRKGLLGSITHTQPTKSSVSGSAIETAKDLGIGVIGGGIVGAAVGRGSLLLGLATTFAGHYTDQRLLQAFGFGMMAANGFQTKTAGVNGLDGLEGMNVDAIKGRLVAYKNTFSEKLFLDKILKKAPAVSGLGEVQYFTYNDADQMGAIDLTALDAIERQIKQSGEDFRTKNPSAVAMSGRFDGAEDSFDSDPIF